MCWQPEVCQLRNTAEATEGELLQSQFIRLTIALSPSDVQLKFNSINVWFEPPVVSFPSIWPPFPLNKLKHRCLNPLVLWYGISEIGSRGQRIILSAYGRIPLQ